MTVYLPCAVASFLGHGCKKTFFFFYLKWKNKLIASSDHALLAREGSPHLQRALVTLKILATRPWALRDFTMLGLNTRDFCCSSAQHSQQGFLLSSLCFSPPVSSFLAHPMRTSSSGCSPRWELRSEDERGGRSSEPQVLPRGQRFPVPVCSPLAGAIRSLPLTAES